MAKVRIGLDIGATAVRAAELQGGDARRGARGAGSAARGAIENGEIRQPEAVTEALRELWQRGGFKNRQVYMGVGNQRVVVREVALPVAPREGAPGVARVPGAGVHPDAGRGRRAGLRPAGRVRAGRAPHAPGDPRRRAEGMVEHGRRRRLARQARAAGRRPGSVRHGPRGRACRRSVMEEEEGGEEAIIDIGADGHEHLRPRDGASRGSSGSCRRAGTTSRSRSPGLRRRGRVPSA